MGVLALRAADLRVFDGQPRLHDLRLGVLLGMAQPRDVRRIIKRNMGELTWHGEVCALSAQTSFRGGRPATEYWLSEHQAYRICVWSRTERAAHLQHQMAEVFYAWRHGQLSPAMHRPHRGKNGRGRLSSIEMLPEFCEEDVAWAAEQLRARRIAQVEVLSAFNARLAAKGQSRISKGAFSRWSVHQAAVVTRLEQDRQITGEIIARLGPGDVNDGMIVAAEAVRERIMHCTDGIDDTTPKSISDMALALQRVSNVAAHNGALRRVARKEG